jgi:hypothetical protein
LSNMYRYKVRVGSEEVDVVLPICFCGKPIRPQDPSEHNPCRRQIEEENAMQREKERQAACLEQFGTVLSRHEHQRRLYPNDKIDGAESYNAQLKREAEEKKAAHFKKLRDRDLHKERLPQMEQELKWLKAQIQRDQEEEKQEQLAKEQTQ